MQEDFSCGLDLFFFCALEFFGGNSFFTMYSLRGFPRVRTVMSFMDRTRETPARPLWAYIYSMSFIDSRKGHTSGYLCITLYIPVLYKRQMFL